MQRTIIKNFIKKKESCEKHLKGNSFIFCVVNFQNINYTMVNFKY